MNGLKKNLQRSPEQLRSLVTIEPRLTVTRQCELLGLNRSTFYYQPLPETTENLELMKKIDRLHLQCPFYGARKISKELGINRKRASNLMDLMGMEAMYPKPRLSQSGKPSERFPYALRGVEINRPNQVWSVDITYIPMKKEFLYLVAVIDWFSRYVLSWELSNTMNTDFCLSALEKAFEYGIPDIFNNDQGSQFTSQEFVNMLKSRNIKISWDGRSRALDNVFIERLWWRLKHEEVYLNAYESGLECWSGIDRWMTFYNNIRIHEKLYYQTPFMVYIGKNEKAVSPICMTKKGRSESTERALESNLV